jgi:hypothetical protein
MMTKIPLMAMAPADECASLARFCDNIFCVSDFVKLSKRDALKSSRNAKA